MILLPSDLSIHISIYLSNIWKGYPSFIAKGSCGACTKSMGNIKTWDWLLGRKNQKNAIRIKFIPEDSFLNVSIFDLNM